MKFCGYCGLPYQGNDWHGCAPAKRARKRLAATLCAIDEQMRGGPDEAQDRTNQIRAIKTQLEITK